VAVYAGAGNNGGDAWVVARALAAAGVVVRVHEVEPARTDDARAERDLAIAAQTFDVPNGAEGVIVDGVLGTGSRGEPRGASAEAVATIARGRAAGARVAALDLPSGLHPELGDAYSVIADLTLSFGSIKRGQLLARERCGTIAVLDIGLAPDAIESSAPFLVDESWVLERVPRFGVAAHKGDRRRVALVGGAEGMAGAIILAGRAALRAGAGLVRIVTAPASLPAVQAAIPEALADAWVDDTAPIPVGWAHALVVGPGLGVNIDSRTLVDRLLWDTDAAVVLDADALTMFEHMQVELTELLAGKRAVLTPHPAEMARLSRSLNTEGVLAFRFSVGADLAGLTGAVVLLKGAPTIISAPDGRRAIVARGTPALATGGSGDVLSGVVATLLAQMNDPFDAAVCAAWAHGRAAELAHEGRSPRGTVLGDILEALGHVWDASPSSIAYPVLAELPPVPT
jgi:NAD(P)H-hydrate epimerase